jgi:gas vesicle protein
MSTSEPGASTTTPPPGYREGLASNGGEQSTKDQAQEKAQQAAGQAKEQAQQVAGQAKSRARTVVDERSTQAGQQVNQQAGDLRTVGQKLREEGKEGPAKIADQAADRGERLGRYLEQSDADRILSDIEDLGRRQPWAVALGGLALGFAASRFLKASSRSRYEQGGAGTWQTARRPGQDRIPSQVGGGAGGVASDVGTTPVATGTGTGTGARANGIA